jgi:hypothetical protein
MSAAGHALIRMTNHWHSLKMNSKLSSSIKPEEVVVIASIVNQITKGHGQVLSIKNSDQTIEK